MIEPILLAVAPIQTLLGDQVLTQATGFFFENDDRLYLITNRHVLRDDLADHRPDRLIIDLHVNPDNLVETSQITLPLYQQETALWNQAVDSTAQVDVVAVPLEESMLPPGAHYFAFTPDHIPYNLDRIDVHVGDSVLIPGFPLGFHDSLHHLPVARQAIVASAFGLRFQGQGYFLTDGRLHRGASGSPVVLRTQGNNAAEPLQWILLGVHSSRFDATRDPNQDEPLGLNCAWYSDVLLPLTEPLSEESLSPATNGSL